MRARPKRRQATGPYPPLLWATVFLLLALGLWWWQHTSQAGVVDEGTLNIARTQRVPNSGLPQRGDLARTDVTLYDVRAGTQRALPMEEYIVGVVAAEMPAGFAPDALRAQAVAARTRTVASLLALGGNGCTRQLGADICSDSGHCQAWEDDLALRDRWGADYALYSEKIASAVRDTAGEIMTYNGTPILVLYHANSGGETEDVEHVFSQALPYLRGVSSPGEESGARYDNEQRWTYAQATAILNDAFPAANLKAAALPESLAVVDRFDSGRVGKVRLGQTVTDGRGLRAALGLYSTLFSLDFEQGMLVIRQRGYGHGVGMSQVGADAMARAGNDYLKILEHYYQGVRIEQF